MVAQMAQRVDSQPVGRPRQKAELAKAATSTGPSRWLSSQRARTSAASAPMSRHTWSEAVLHIMVWPPEYRWLAKNRSMAV